MLVVSAVLLCLVAAASHASPVFQLSHEWHLWKTEHQRSYASDNEELERHLIWLANKKYIEGHNANEHVFGYRLSMNQYGDLVCGLRVG